MILEYGVVPEARPGLVVSDFQGEFVVVDPHSGVAHELSDDYAMVWAAIEHRAWPPPLPEDRIREVVTELRQRGLLSDPTGVSRRTVLKAGAAGGASVALLGLTSMALPSAAMAASEPLPLASPSPGVQSSGSETDSFTILAGATVAVALVGGGGGGSDTNGSGGPGQVWLGTVENTTGSPIQVNFTLGGGGTAYGAGGSGGLYGGSGGSGGSDQKAGAGGGASTLYVDANTILAVAAGGGGGGDGNPSANSANGPSSSHVNSSIAGQSGDLSGGGGGGGQATGGDKVYGGATPQGYSGGGGYAGSTNDTSLGYSTYGGTGGTTPGGLVVTLTSTWPSNYLAPSAGGTTPGSGAPPTKAGYQGGIYVDQTS